MAKQNIWETITEREHWREEKEELEDITNSLENLKEEISEQMIKIQSEFTTQMKLLREEIRTGSKLNWRNLNILRSIYTFIYIYCFMIVIFYYINKL